MEQNKELPKRKTPRLQNFDYNIEGAYFITICTQNRKNILSSIVGEGSALPHLSHCGKIVDRWIQELPQKYSEISVDHYVIMPNHIHLILSLHKGNGNGRADPHRWELKDLMFYSLIDTIITKLYNLATNYHIGSLREGAPDGVGWRSTRA